MIKQIEEILDYYEVRNYIINEDGSVDVDGDLILSKKSNPQKLPSEDEKIDGLRIQFGMVNGNFDCSYMGLTSLLGCPRWVSGHYLANNNFLHSLELLPKYIGGNLHLQMNCLSNLEFPEMYIKGQIYIWNNKNNSEEVKSIIKDWGYTIEKGTDEIGSIKRYFLNQSRLKKIESLLNG